MMGVGVKINGVQKVDTRMSQYIRSGSNLCASTNLKIALPMFRELKMTAPVFRGYLQRDMMMEVHNESNKSTTYIRFPTHDPEDGHPYVHFAEHGRAAIHGKTNPMMRYWTNPSGMGAGTHGRGMGATFARNVGPAEPSFFIRNTMVAYKPLAPYIAAIEVKKWLRA